MRGKREFVEISMARMSGSDPVTHFFCLSVSLYKVFRCFFLSLLGMICYACEGTNICKPLIINCKCQKLYALLDNLCEKSAQKFIFSLAYLPKHLTKEIYQN